LISSFDSVDASLFGGSLFGCLQKSVVNRDVEQEGMILDRLIWMIRNETFEEIC